MTMKRFVLFFLCSLIVISTTKTQKPKRTKAEAEAVNVCEGVHVDGKVHKRRILMNGINRPYQLAISTHEHEVFFSYNVGNDTADTFGIAYVKINDTMPREINDVKNGFALAVDEHNNKIYFGGSEGIYQADLKDLDKVEHIVKERNIWDMFYNKHNHHLYFIEYPSQRLHVYDIKNDKVHVHEHIEEKIYQFAIDGDHDTFITTKDGLFEIKNGTNTTIPYHGPKLFRCIEVNHKGVVHLCGKGSIYVPQKKIAASYVPAKKNKSLIEIAKIKNIFGLTFDAEDNIIYSNPHEIVKLLPHDCK